MFCLAEWNIVVKSSPLIIINTSYDFTFLEHKFKCSFCEVCSESENSAIRHCMRSHDDEKISYLHFFKSEDKLKYKICCFKITGSELNCDPKSVYINQETGKLNIPIQQCGTSPIKKMCKVNNSSNSVHNKVFNDIDNTSSTCEG